LSEERLKIAVFIDFDNIEIGVKTTLSQHFDVGAVLEAIKERGEIVTKIAYGDWTRAGDYGRAMSQHAIHMVQRNLTPGGDKNGADINLALDALEMAFTHNHINTFVIVGGDSDFISLVEKLKQYDRKVYVVGGRAFTSVVMQKNCTEFLAYENLLGRGRPTPRGKGAGAPTSDLSQAMPLVRRALKLLADREVLPQLGLLKSTLLQLDSAFSERDYGASSFRDFVQKLANAGFVSLKGNDRSFQVELREAGDVMTPSAPALASPPQTGIQPATVASGNGSGEITDSTAPAETQAETSRFGPADALRLFRQVFMQPKSPPRWPMYVRQVKQFVKAVDPQFDERAYGFGGIIEALRYCQREGLFRIERDRLGVVRVFPGPALQRPGADPAASVVTEDAGSERTRELPAGTKTPTDVVPILAEEPSQELDATDSGQEPSDVLPFEASGETAIGAQDPTRAEDDVTTVSPLDNRGGRRRRSAPSGGRSPKAAGTARKRATSATPRTRTTKAPKV
jgi:uncharacterized LabA/DUF88 family protein